MLFDSPPKNWQVSTLGEICQEGGGDIQTGPFGSQLHASDYVISGIPSIMPANIKEGRVSEGGIARITEADAKRLSKYLTKAGDIVYSRRGDVERCALIRKHEEGWLCGTGCLRVRPGSGVVDPDFCSHFLSHPETKEWISRHAVGATMPNLNTQILSALPVLLPSLQEQKQIAHILGTLDDRIELNRKTNETLESMAKALFKSWFVDFDPVRAKAEVRPTGLPAEISDLFPDSLEDSELGEIPSGWRVAQVGERLETVLGGTPLRKRSDYWGGDIPWIGSGMVNEFRVTRPTESITELGLAESATKLLPIRSTLIAITGATLGQVSTNEIEVCANQSVVAILPSSDFGAEYVHLWILSNIDILVSSQTGGAQQHVNKNNVNELPLLVPSLATLARFSASTKPLYDKIAINIFSSELLQNIRDSLLPKLISGEIRIPDAEKMLEEVGV
ncbi:restriction endonuclease subunit S [Synechococcus sp. CBW1107]|uniref:restriction endonuclease subunit S n=1 Tax=Synechococcus sp. CBW1107 TaxID=2789857 RepID=UPI002AD3F3B0|nr:restriction endonuclease subunit S [Synechococcus sp. CBW1107]CAK6687358.1 hypothetical protein ICNINCKA_00187 [Synechococcus sp. CBW1107]